MAAEDLPMQAAAKGIEVLDVELDLVTQNGATITKLLGNAAPLFDEQGNCRGSIGAFWILPNVNGSKNKSDS